MATTEKAATAKKPLAPFKDIAMREDAFGTGHTLCPGCGEAVTFHTIGRASDNGRKTCMVLGTSCGEVSTLMFPNVIAWGRGKSEPDEFTKSLGITHHVFESAPTVSEAIRDTATALQDVGAWKGEAPNVISWSGDGGAVAIGLRALLHATYRKARIAIFVNINEVFANTGFQYSPTSLPYADSSTLPYGGPADPIDYLGLVVMAGATFVAQASPAFPQFFAEVVKDALDNQTGTSVVFVPSPCIAGWKFEEGQTSEIGKLGGQTGLFPMFRKKAGEPGEVKFVPDKAKRPSVEKFLMLQQRFDHLVRKSKEEGKWEIRPGHEVEIAALQSYADRNVERLTRLAAF